MRGINLGVLVGAASGAATALLPIGIDWRSGTGLLLLAAFLIGFGMAGGFVAILFPSREGRER